MRLKNFVESQQLDLPLITNLFSMADFFRKSKELGISLNPLQGKTLATLFYEPSTRTRLSFESAMLGLGGNVLSTENAKEFSSAVKGETLEDSIRIISHYCDCIVLRHHEDGAAKRASVVATVPVINAGDGKGQHPTQALLDIYTILRECGRLEGLSIAMVGDLASGRTVRSLCYLIGKLFKDNKLLFVSPENLKIGEDIKAYLTKQGVIFQEEADLNNVLPEADVIYMTRIQKERISKEDFAKADGKYIIDSSNLPLIRSHARIMHPLPKINEINLPIDVEKTDSRVAYFRQAENGLYIRMALLYHLLNLSASES